MTYIHRAATFRKGENYRPIIWITPPKRCSREALFSSSWHFLFRRRGSASGSDLGGSTPGQSPHELRFFLSHFPPRRTSSKPTGPRSAPPLSCGDVLSVSAIQSSAMGAAASRRTINITTGLGSGAVTALGATRPSLSSRRFLCLTRTIACWLVAKPCGGAWRSTALGKRRRLRSKTPIAYPTPPRSAAGPRAWTPLQQPVPFYAKRSLASLIGCHAAIRPILGLGRYLG